MSEQEFSKIFVKDVLGGAVPPKNPYPESVHFSKLVKWMKDYYRAGIKVIPVRVWKEEGKKQLSFYSGGWKKAVPSLEHQLYALYTFSANNRTGMPANALAILTGSVSNLLILDIDQPVKEAWDIITSNKIAIPSDAFSIRTQSGGEQIYFRYDPDLDDCATTSSKFFGKGTPIDIRGNGGLAIAYPSVVYDKESSKRLPYTVKTKGKIHKLPSRLKELILYRKKDTVDNQDKNLDRCNKDITALSEKQGEWLRRAYEEALNAQVGMRSEAYFKLFCTAVTLGISIDELRAYTEGLPKIKEKPEYFDYIWAGAIKQVDPVDRSYKKSGPKDLVKNDPTKVSDLVKSVLEYDNKKVESLDWLIPNFIAKHQLVCYAGAPDTGKSITWLDVIKCAAKRDDLFGGAIHAVKRNIKTLYIDGDKGRRLFTAKYFNKLGLNKRYILPVFVEDFVKAGIDFDISEKGSNGYMVLKQLVSEFKADMIVVDSFTGCCPSVDANKQSELAPALNTLKKLAQETDTAIIIVHHTRKKQQGQTRMGADDIAGSGVWKRLSDFQIIIDELFDEETGDVIRGSGRIKVAKGGSTGNVTINFKEYSIEDYGDRMEVVYKDSEVDPMPSVPVRARVINSVIKLLEKGERSSGSIYENVGGNSIISRKTFYAILKDMKEKGLIKSIGSTRCQVIVLGGEGEKVANEQKEKEKDMFKKEEAEQKRRRIILWAMFKELPGGKDLTPLTMPINTLKDSYESWIEYTGEQDSKSENFELFSKDIHNFRQDYEYMIDEGYIEAYFNEGEEWVRLSSKGQKAVVELFYRKKRERYEKQNS